MPRAHRHYLEGQIWHLTHRCHERRFLLRFRRDRQAWMEWLYEARKRFDLCVLDTRSLATMHTCWWMTGRAESPLQSRCNW